MAGTHSISNIGFDPNIGGAILPTVGQGLHSLKLGTVAPSIGRSDRFSYTFTVTASNAKFGFKYALVMQDGNHTGTQNPFFTYNIVNGTNPNILINNDLSSNVIASNSWKASENDIFFKKRNGFVYRNWSWECIDLTAKIGQVVTISFYSVDCVFNQGHICYAYIDGLCSNNTPSPVFTMKDLYCIDDDIAFDGSLSSEEDSYYVSVVEANQNWTPTPGGTDVYQWFDAQQVGPFDLKAFLASYDKKFECNKYYRIKLAVTNKCNIWQEKTKLIFVKCPVMNELPDIKLCCANLGTQPIVTLGPISNYVNPTTNLPASPYSFVDWSVISGSGTFVPPPGASQISANFQITGNATVQIKVSELESIFPPKYCSATQTVNIIVADDFNVNIVQEVIRCCESKLTAVVTFPDGCNKWNGLQENERQNILDNLQYLWSNGATTASIDINSNVPPGTFTSTVSFPPCYSHTVSYNYTAPLYHPNNIYSTPLTGNNALATIYNPPNNKLIIKAGLFDSQGLLYPPTGTLGVYKSEYMRIIIFNRWGEQIKNIRFDDCGALRQDDVSWDGTDEYGSFVQQGIYIYKLYVKVCGNEEKIICNNTGDLQSVPVGDQLGYSCNGWVKIPKFPWWKWGPKPCNDIPNFGACAFRITVLN
jgi:hypothetical protein